MSKKIWEYKLRKYTQKKVQKCLHKNNIKIWIKKIHIKSTQIPTQKKGRFFVLVFKIWNVYLKFM